MADEREAERNCEEHSVEARGVAVGETLDITMPDMGESVTEGVILEWAKRPGDAVQEDETLVEISTDKVDAELPAPATGTLTEVHAQAGETVKVGQVIARMTVGARATARAGRPEPRRDEASLPAEDDQRVPRSPPRLAAEVSALTMPIGRPVQPTVTRFYEATCVDLPGSGAAVKVLSLNGLL